MAMIVNLPEQFILDSAGNKVAVILAIETYQQILDQLDEFHCQKAYEEALSETSIEMSSGDYVSLESYITANK